MKEEGDAEAGQIGRQVRRERDRQRIRETETVDRKCRDRLKRGSEQLTNKEMLKSDRSIVK